MTNRIIHYILIGLGAAAVAIGVASGQTWLVGAGGAVTALAGASGTRNAPAVGQSSPPGAS